MNFKPFSHSKIKTADCMKKFEFKYVLKVKKHTSLAQRRGAALHHAFYLYWEHCKKEGKNYFDEWESVVEEALKTHKLPLKEEGDFYEAVRQFISSREFEPDCFLGTEIKLAVNADGKPVDFESKDALFRGIVDRLDKRDNKLLITDYKTGMSMQFDKTQFEVYAWLLSKHYPDMDYFLGVADFTKLDAQKDFEIKKEDLRRIERRIERKIQEIESCADFAPTPGENCISCEYYAQCPAMKDLTLPQAPQNKGDLKEVLTRYHAAESARKTCIEQLKAYVDVCEPVEDGAKQWNYYPSDVRKFDLEKFCAEMKEDCFEPMNFLKVDTTKLCREAISSPALRDIILRSSEKTVRVTFTARKKREGEKGGRG